MKKFSYKHIHNYATFSIVTVDRKIADGVMGALVDNPKDWSYVSEEEVKESNDTLPNFRKRKGMYGKLVDEKL